MKNKSISVLIADNHCIIRCGIKSIINEQTNMAVVGETANVEKTIEIIQKFKPDVILMDNKLPGCRDYECSKRITNAGQTKVIIFSDIHNINYAMRLLELGASGYLIENCKPNEVIIAIKAVCRGEEHLSKKLFRQLTGNYLLNSSTENENQPNRLTPKESEVLSFISAGYLPKCIAQFLNIEYCTVMTHKKRILRKLNLNNDVELTKYAIRNGLTSLN